MSQGRLERETAGRTARGRVVMTPLAGGARVLLLVLACGLAGSAPARGDTPEAPLPADSAGVRPLVEAGIVLLPNAGTRPAQAVQPPSDLHDLSAWIDYRLHGHVEALPYQSRLFYRRGLLLHRSGNREEALRLVYGAIELDPQYVAPHLTLASWLLLSSPSQALLHYAVVLEIARKSFMMQLGLAANSIYLGLQALLIALIVAGFMILAMHQAELRHAWHERLGQRLTPTTARWWAAGLLVLPFLLGFGPVLPTVLLLALLWPLLRRNERFVFVVLALFLGTAPLTMSALDTLAAPLRENRAPYYGISMVERAPYRESTHQRLRALAAAHPDDGFVQFALGWTARRGGALAEAEQAYRHALERWPGDDRVLTDLGNTLAMQGRTDDAVAAYDRALQVNPANAAAHFNRAQLKTLQFDFREATEDLSRASALDFDMVKSFQGQQTDDGYLPLVDQWLSPATMWNAMPPIRLGGDLAPSLPPFWRSRIEFSGWPFSAAAIVLTILALMLGVRLNHGIPLRRCSNCGAVVCRRCAERRRERALCPNCAAIEARAESQEFGRVLLAQHRRQHAWITRLGRTALATLLPGYGLILYRRMISGLATLTCAAVLASLWLGFAGPFPYESGLHLPEAALPVPILVGLTIAVYLSSLIGYFSNVARARAQAAYLAAPTRSRAVQATERHPAAAA